MNYPENRHYALFDNSAFAGLMRCYLPELDAHKVFWREFPEHREVDYVSLSQFLTAICIYDCIVIESSSRASWVNKADVQDIEEYELSELGYPRPKDTWVVQLCNELPSKIADILSPSPLLADEKKHLFVYDERAKILAFRLFQSPLRHKLRLVDGEKIPNVYTSKSYVCRKFFEDLNLKSSDPLSDDLLAQAMFLYRGLFLQACSKGDYTYIPYLYRGAMLNKIPPAISNQILEVDADHIALLSTSGKPDAQGAMKELSSFYYDLIEKLTWTTYDDSIPFLGASILAKVKGRIDDAFDVALDFRSCTKVRSFFREMECARQDNDRVLYEVYLDEIKADLLAAARHVGLNDAHASLGSFYRLSTFWLPDGITEAIEETAVKLIPSDKRHLAKRVASKLIAPKIHQMLLIDHVRALKSP